MNNPFTWMAIGLDGTMIAGVIMGSKVDIEREKTKQLEFRLQMEQLHVGVTTNTPTK